MELYRFLITERDILRFQILCQESGKKKKYKDDDGNVSACRIWTGPTTRSRHSPPTDRYGLPNKGHGVFRFETTGAGVFAHRLAYLLATGTDPGAFCDQRCHNTLCVEPKHLISFAPPATKRTRWPVIHATCQHGHVRTVQNTYICPSTGKRDCRDCWVIKDKKREDCYKCEDGTYSPITEELLCEVFALRQQRVPWREIARRVKVSPPGLKYQFRKRWK